MSLRARVVVVSGALVALSQACSDSPLPIETSTPAYAEPVVPTFPPITRPAAIFRADSLPNVRAYASQYVLYTDGTFAVQFTDGDRFFDITGHYTRSGSVLTFQFDPDSWSIGTLRGGTLDVKYNAKMSADDFVDGTYYHISGSL